MSLKNPTNMEKIAIVISILAIFSVLAFSLLPGPMELLLLQAISTLAIVAGIVWLVRFLRKTGHVKAAHEKIQTEIAELKKENEPRSRQCPACGSSSFRRVASESAHFVYDRICRDCDTRFTPPTPSWMPVAGIVAGLGISSLGAVALVFALSNWKQLEVDHLKGLSIMGGAFLFGLIVIVAGIRSLIRNRQTSDM